MRIYTSVLDSIQYWGEIHFTYVSYSYLYSVVYFYRLWALHFN